MVCSLNMAKSFWSLHLRETYFRWTLPVQPMPSPQPCGELERSHRVPQHHFPFLTYHDVLLSLQASCLMAVRMFPRKLENKGIWESCGFLLFFWEEPVDSSPQCNRSSFYRPWAVISKSGSFSASPGIFSLEFGGQDGAHDCSRNELGTHSLSSDHSEQHNPYWTANSWEWKGKSPFLILPGLHL